MELCVLSVHLLLSFYSHSINDITILSPEHNQNYCEINQLDISLNAHKD